MGLICITLDGDRTFKDVEREMFTDQMQLIKISFCDYLFCDDDDNENINGVDGLFSRYSETSI